MSNIDPLLAPIQALAALPKGTSTRAAYERLSEALVTVFPALRSRSPENVDRFAIQSALSNAVRATGLPDNSGGGVTAESVATAICDAVTATDAKRVYLCPLNYGAELLPRKFGPCEVQKFSQSELEAELQIARLKRQTPQLRLDTKLLSLFQWLVVRETVLLPERIGQRSVPMFYRIAGQDYGEINPHASTWPRAVEEAAFALLLLPWEDLVRDPNVDWRPFRIPWVYTSEHDPFVRLATPEDADSLALEPFGYEDPKTGEWDEWEVPMRTELAGNKNDAIVPLTDQRWNEITSALHLPAFNQRVVHFLVRAFATDGIDEFLAHAITIEAALGRPEDFHGSTRPRIGRQNPGATERVARRVEAILSDASAYRDYKELFDLRSKFVHGSCLAKIPSETRLKARRLARRVADALVSAASSTTYQDRNAFLSALCP
jgi:hypothetical protein